MVVFAIKPVKSVALNDPFIWVYFLGLKQIKVFWQDSHFIELI